MSGKRKRSRSRKKNKYQNKYQKKGIYAVAALAVVALVGVAFFSPGWLFGFQDRRQYDNIVLEERENVDVAVLSTNYENSFYQRMVNFAESQANRTNFYVTVEELTDYQRLRTFLESDAGLYGEDIGILISTQMISTYIVEAEISAWKQYVIYSDDYAKGVNFILWYIELEHPDEAIGTYKLLLEANTGELYGLYADTGGIQIPYETANGMSMGWNINANKCSLNELLGFTSMESYGDAWQTMAYFYSGLTETDFFDFYELFYSVIREIYGKVYIDVWNAVVPEQTYGEILEKMGMENNEWGDFLRTNAPLMLVRDDGNRLECIFPYGESQMVFQMQMAESISYPWMLRSVTIGFPDIYSLIPEFE